MWVVRYLRSLFEWSFGHWRKHTALVALAVSVLVGLGVLRGGLPRLGVYFAVWLIVLIFVVAPARAWRDTDIRTTPRIRFIQHRDNHAVEPENADTIYLRVTVENTALDSPLTGVEIVLASSDPMPNEFMTLAVPLLPMHAADQTRFSLRPRFPQTVNVVSANTEGENTCYLWHNTQTVPHDFPDGTYRLKFVATANETSPAEQMATLELRHEAEYVDEWVRYTLVVFRLTLDPSH